MVSRNVTKMNKQPVNTHHDLLDGHFLNLPVLEDDEIVGMVDVLRLTYATLEQVLSDKLGYERDTKYVI